jgi:hypothetical protein
MTIQMKWQMTMSLKYYYVKVVQMNVLFATVRFLCVKNVEMAMICVDVMEIVIGVIEKWIADRMDGRVMNVIDGDVAVAE